MTNKEMQYSESIEWSDETETTGVFTYTEEAPIYLKDNNELVGKNKQEITSKVTRDDLTSNLALKQEMYDKTSKKLKDLQSQKEKLGNKPARTSEMVHIERALQELGKIKQHEELDAQIAEEEKEADKLKIWIDKRQNTIKTKFKPQ